VSLYEIALAAKRAFSPVALVAEGRVRAFAQMHSRFPYALSQREDAATPELEGPGIV